MFEKLVAIEPVSLIPSAEEELHRYAKEVVLYRDVPASDDEMVRRIGDADAVLLSYTSRMGKEVIAQCPNIRYIGMCCSLYSEESANVDIAYARTRGIQVLGIRDYGDRGVVEYVLHELTGLLHGFGMPMLRDEPVEITGLKVGIVGLGVSGRMIADALQFMGAEISYFARSAKPDAEAAGMTFKPLAQLLAESEVVFTCLNKNVLLLGENEFASWAQARCCSTPPSAPASIPLRWKSGSICPAPISSATPAPPQAPWPRTSLPGKTCAAPMCPQAAPSRLLCC